MNNFRAALNACPLIAILRGVAQAEVLSVGAVLVDAGIHIIEVPLNSPEPLESIRLLSREFGTAAIIGAGTVTTETEVRQVQDAGGRLIVMPHADFDVVFAAIKAGLFVTPGVATPTEAFATLNTGADALKLFPGEMITPAVVKALRAVLPKDAVLIPVGGITAANMAAYIAAGASAFGVGSTLYAPGRSLADIGARARSLAGAARGQTAS